MKILYTDKEIVVAVKPYGVLSEDAGEGSMPALLKGELGPVFAVHRLDRAVGGVMVYARTKAAASVLSRAVAEHKLRKEYAAVVEGVPSAPEGELRDLLFKDAKQNKSFVVNTPRRGAREAVLTYRTTGSATLEDRTLTRLAISLETGRSHQIRVQFASRGTPLVGDGKYGARTKAAHVALFSVGLAFKHPKTGKEMAFTAEVPSDFPWSAFDAPTYEIEHKYLIAMPDISALSARPDCRILSITQTYLRAPLGETHRVRRIVEGARERFTETRKRRVTDLRAVEEEREITAEEYGELLTLADPNAQPVLKTRYRIPHAGHTLEIDVYPFWDDRAIAEIEVKSEAVDVALPEYVKLISEVTSDKRYKNVNLARCVPNDDISALL